MIPICITRAFTIDLHWKYWIRSLFLIIGYGPNTGHPRLNSIIAYHLCAIPGCMAKSFQYLATEPSLRMWLKILYGRQLSHLCLICKVRTTADTVEPRCVWRNMLWLWYLYTCSLRWCRHSLWRFYSLGTNIYNADVYMPHWCKWYELCILWSRLSVIRYSSDVFV